MRTLGASRRDFARWLLLWIWLIQAAIWAVPGRAVPAQSTHPGTGFGQYKHNRWTVDDGAPTGIREIAQTPDGFLWLASAKGLYRFDGVTFERIAAPRGSAMEYAAPSAFVVSRAGELWVGYHQTGGVAVYRDGRLQDMRMPRPPDRVDDMVQTPDGAIWAATSNWTNRLRRYVNGRWELADERLGLPEGSIGGLKVTRDGTLWAPFTVQDEGRTSLLSYLPAGAAHFKLSEQKLAGFASIGIDADSNFWISDALGTRMLFDRQGRRPARQKLFPAVPGFRVAHLAFDRSGGIWGTTGPAGIFHIPQAAAPNRSQEDGLRRFGAADGLTSDVTFSVFADREGSIWIGSALGLDQFRPARVQREPNIPLDPIKGHMIARSKDGAVWFGSAGFLFVAAPRQRPVAAFDIGSDLYSICPAREEGIWAVRLSRIVHIRRGKRTEFAPPPGGGWALTCGEDRKGRLWLGLSNGVLTWHDAAGWHVPGSTAAKQVAELVATPSGDIAFRTDRGEIGVVDADSGSVRHVFRSGLRSLSMIEAGTRDVFVSGSNALLRLRNGQWRRLEARRFPWLSQLRGLVQTSGGESWLMGDDGIFRVRTADLDRAFENPAAPLPRTLFDTHDGWTSTTQPSFFVGTQAVAGDDGRIWFVDRAGALVIDPANLKHNDLVPPVIIRSLTSGGHVYRDPRKLTLPPGTRSLDITYTATSLGVPQRAQFRYRLEGVEDGWIDPGVRRVASYANLGPGNYRFRVIAANEDGVWNRAGATLPFEIRPTFTQSWPFRAACIAGLAGLLLLAYSLRLRTVAERVRMRMAERMDERERIARELHDTLLQSVQALTLRFQLAINDFPPEGSLRPKLEQALDSADQVIAEGRDRVLALRSSSDADIGERIRDVVAGQSFGTEVEIAITIHGAQRMLDPAALDEIVRIASEAIFNIRRHASAKRVTIDIDHARKFGLRIADDGIGIDPRIAASGKREGHFGLAGMRERAAKLHAMLAVRRLPQGGTEVVLTVPASVAYPPRMPRLFARLRGAS